MLTRNVLASFAAAVMMTAVPATAQTTLAQSPATAVDYGSGFVGQSFTVGTAGTNYNNIKFNWVTVNNTGTLAPGNIYLFSSPYAGTPNGLFTATGTLGTAFGVNGVYTFTPTLRLTGGSTYYAYTDTSFNPGGNDANPYSGGVSYFSNSATRNFSSAPSFDNAFRVTGVAVAPLAPEPATWAMMILGFGMVGGTLRRRRRAPATGTGLLATA